MRRALVALPVRISPAIDFEPIVWLNFLLAVTGHRGWKVPSSRRNIADTIGSLYDAAVTAGSWGEASEALRRLYDAEFVLLQAINPERATTDILGCIGHSADDLRVYAAHYSDKDPWVLGGKSLPLGTPFRFSDVAPEAELVEGEFYCDFLKPRCGLLRGVACILPADDGCIVGLGVERPGPGRDFQSSDLATLSVLIPHLQRAILLGGHWQQVERLAVLGAGMVDIFTTGIVVVDERARVMLINAAARRIVDQCDGVMISEGRLLTSSPTQAAALDGIIRAAIKHPAASVFTTPAAIRARRRRSADVSVIVMPLPPSAVGVSNGRPGAVVFLTDEAERSRVPHNVLRQLFGLTKGETHLANLIAAGHTLEAAASALSITRNSARNRLQVVYSKTATSRQSQLASLLSRLGLLTSDR
jgi:DNA-binding CsgD family transcriptional regulator